MAELTDKKQDNVAKKTRHDYLGELLFSQSLIGVFFMMLDEPVRWDDSVDKEKVLDYVFAHQRVTEANRAMLKQHDLDKEKLIGLRPSDIFAYDLEEGRRIWRELFDKGYLHTEIERRGAGDSLLRVLGDYICLYDEEGRITGHFGIQLDISNIQAIETRLKDHEQKFRLFAENAADTIWVYNIEHGKSVFISSGITTLLGYSSEEALRLTPAQIYPKKYVREIGLQLDTLLKPEDGVLGSSKFYTAEMYRKDGSLIWVEHSVALSKNAAGETEIVSVLRDISDRKKKEAEIEYLYNHDTLTGLLNRNAVSRRITAAQNSTTIEEIQSVIFVNIDKFRFINDYFGHQAGDELLIKIADRLKELIGKDDEIYRFGGDEFLLIVCGNDEVQICDLAEKIRTVLGEHRLFSPDSIRITASIGIAFGKDDENLAETLKKGETALFIANKEKNKIIIYSEKMEEQKSREELLDQHLAVALERGQFELYFQPIYDLRRGRINQVEVLLRWHHPEFGMVSPVEFIPIAERNREIIPITDWVIRATCEKALEWDKLGKENMFYSINLSAVALENRGDELTEHIRKTLSETGLNPSRLKLEITESTMMLNQEEVIRVFEDLNLIGVRFALDDFGTGYASFGYIKDLPLHVIKIDRSLVIDLVEEEKSRMILAAIISISRELGLETVVEGVETATQLDLVTKMGADYIQGYYFSPPLSEEGFLNYCDTQGLACGAKINDLTPQSSFGIRVKWREEWESGENMIDLHHQALMKEAYDLFARFPFYDQDNDFIADIDELKRQIEIHFEYEEKTIEEAGYPYTENHARLHRNLVEKLEEMRDGYLGGDVKPTDFFSYLLNDVLLNHVLEDDVRFFPYTRKKYVERADDE